MDYATGAEFSHISREVEMHRWSDDDNLIAYHVFRFGKHDLPSEPHEMGDILGMGYNSFMLKVSNFKSIAGIGGLEGYSHQAVRVYDAYSKMSDGEARAAGVAAMARVLDAHTNR